VAWGADELRARQRWYPAEEKRIWAWLQHLADNPGDARSMARHLHSHDHPN